MFWSLNVPLNCEGTVSNQGELQLLTLKCPLGEQLLILYVPIPVTVLGYVEHDSSDRNKIRKPRVELWRICSALSELYANIHAIFAIAYNYPVIVLCNIENPHRVLDEVHVFRGSKLLLIGLQVVIQALLKIAWMRSASLYIRIYSCGSQYGSMRKHFHVRV